MDFSFTRTTATDSIKGHPGLPFSPFNLDAISTGGKVSIHIFLLFSRHLFITPIP